MKRVFLALVFAGYMLSDLPAQTVAQVGQETITRADVVKFKKQLQESNLYVSTMTDDFLLRRLIDAKIAIMDAKSMKMDQEEDAKNAMDTALYVYYMSKVVDEKFKNKQFSDKDVALYYSNNPVIKIQRLTYVFNPKIKGSIDKARTQMSILRSEIKSKQITFEEAIEKVNDNSVPGLTGTFEKVPLLALPQAEAIQLNGLKLMEISPIIQFSNCFAITRILKMYPLSSEYSGKINNLLKEKTLIKARESYLNSLRQKYSTIIKIY